MPKKFKGENSKAAEARSRLEEKKQLEKSILEKEKEDALWEDNDKLVAKKLQRKENLEKKKNELLQKELEVKKVYEEEMDQIKSSKIGSSEKEGDSSRKVTQIQMLQHKESQLQLLKDRVANRPSNISKPLKPQENVNRLIPIEGEARTVEHALSVLSTQDIELDRHPERRVKAAYALYEETNLPRLKSEFGNMRLSQLKQMLKKEWLKSPHNPLNQHKAAVAQRAAATTTEN